MPKYGLLIDYNFCSGCHTCILACQQEHGFAVDQPGIELFQIGPRLLPTSPNESENWEYDYIPAPTELCDLCEERVAKGKKPSCVHHCQGACMYYGTVEELSKQMAESDRKMVLFAK